MNSDVVKISTANELTKNFPFFMLKHNRVNFFVLTATLAALHCLTTMQLAYAIPMGGIYVGYSTYIHVCKWFKNLHKECLEYRKCRS